jgi:hypothetical protein
MQTVKSIDINAVGFVSYDAYVCDDNNTKYEKEEKVNRRIKKERKGKKSRILISSGRHSINLCVYIYGIISFVFKCANETFLFSFERHSQFEQ